MASGGAPALCITAVPIIISGSTKHRTRRIVHISHYTYKATWSRRVSPKTASETFRLSDFFRPTWEDLVGLRVISVNLISLGLMHKSFTCWFIYSEMACEDNL